MDLLLGGGGHRAARVLDDEHALHLQQVRAEDQGHELADGGPALRLYAPSGDGVSGLDGWLRLNAGRFPHIEADLEYVQVLDGQALGYRLRERRKAPAPSLHYLDSARLGVLAKVTRIE